MFVDDDSSSACSVPGPCYTYLIRFSQEPLEAGFFPTSHANAQAEALGTSVKVT